MPNSTSPKAPEPNAPQRRRGLAWLVEPPAGGGRADTLRARTVNLVMLLTVLLGAAQLLRLFFEGTSSPIFVRAVGAVVLVDLAIYLVSRAGAFRLAVIGWLVWVPVSLFVPLQQAAAADQGFVFLVSMAYLILGPGVAGMVLSFRWGLVVGSAYLTVPFVAAALIDLPVRFPAATVGFLVVGAGLLALHHRVLRAVDRISESRRRERDDATQRFSVAAEALQVRNSELAEASGRLARRTRALEAANRELAAFSHAAAHELRGPTRTVAGFTELLREDLGELDEEPAGHLDRVGNAARRLSLILDGMQAHVDLGTRYPESAPVDTGALLARLVAECRIPEHVEVEQGPGAPVVETDEALLFVALRQLLRHILARDVSKLRRLQLIARAVQGDGCSILINPQGAQRRVTGAPMRHHRTDPFTRLLPSADGMGLVSARKAVSRLGGVMVPLADEGAGEGFRIDLPPRAPVDPADTFVG